jgi:hypothetical protein
MIVSAASARSAGATLPCVSRKEPDMKLMKSVKVLKA